MQPAALGAAGIRKAGSVEGGVFSAAGSPAADARQAEDLEKGVPHAVISVVTRSKRALAEQFARTCRRGIPAKACR